MVFMKNIYKLLIYICMPLCLGWLIAERCTREDRDAYLKAEIKRYKDEANMCEVRKKSLEAISIRKEMDVTDQLILCMKKIIKESEVEANKADINWRKQRNVKKHKK